MTILRYQFNEQHYFDVPSKDSNDLMFFSNEKVERLYERIDEGQYSNSSRFQKLRDNATNWYTETDDVLEGLGFKKVEI